jgi:hypothetical protein
LETGCIGIIAGERMNMTALSIRKADIQEMMKKPPISWPKTVPSGVFAVIGETEVEPRIHVRSVKENSGE